MLKAKQHHRRGFVMQTVNVNEVSSTNYLSPDVFYNKFLFWLVRLQPFASGSGKPPMSAKAFVVAFRVQYGCGLRVSELLNIRKKDLNLKRCILTIPKAKTGTNQKTTILPYDVPMLEDFTKDMDDDQLLFTANRHVMWEYAKDAGRLAGLNIFEEQGTREIEGVWTHLMRKSCSKRMLKLGASRELRMLKLRHAMKDAHDTYDKQDINELRIWEAKHFGSQHLVTKEMLN